MAWDSSERLAVAVQAGADAQVLLYATELHPMMTAHLLGMLHAPSLLSAGSKGEPGGKVQSSMSMRCTDQGSLLALHRHGQLINLIPLLYKGM